MITVKENREEWLRILERPEHQDIRYWTDFRKGIERPHPLELYPHCSEFSERGEKLYGFWRKDLGFEGEGEEVLEVTLYSKMNQPYGKIAKVFRVLWDMQ